MKILEPSQPSNLLLSDKNYARMLGTLDYTSVIGNLVSDLHLLQ